MNISKNGLIELANYEALSHTKYIDSGGVHTIGIGMTTSEIPDLNSWTWERAITTEECVLMYKKATQKYVDGINKVLKNGVILTQPQFDALVSITYNIGIGGMSGSTFMKRVNAGAEDKDVVAAMQAWNKDNGKVVKGLANRRAAEGKVYLTGQYTNDGSVGLIQVNTAHKPVYKGRVSIAEYL